MVVEALGQKAWSGQGQVRPQAGTKMCFLKATAQVWAGCCWQAVAWAAGGQSLAVLGGYRTLLFLFLLLFPPAEGLHRGQKIIPGSWFGSFLFYLIGLRN